MTRGAGGARQRALTTAPLPGCLTCTVFWGICVSASSRVSQVVLCRWSLSAPLTVPCPPLPPTPHALAHSPGQSLNPGPCLLTQKLLPCCMTAWASAPRPQPRGPHVLLLPVRVGTPRGFWVAWQCPHQGEGASSDAGIRPVLSHRQTWRALLMGGLAWLLGSRPLSFWTPNTLCPLVQAPTLGASVSRLVWAWAHRSLISTWCGYRHLKCWA